MSSNKTLYRVASFILLLVIIVFLFMSFMSATKLIYYTYEMERYKGIMVVISGLVTLLLGVIFNSSNGDSNDKWFPLWLFFLYILVAVYCIYRGSLGIIRLAYLHDLYLTRSLGSLIFSPYGRFAPR